MCKSPHILFVYPPVGTAGVGESHFHFAMPLGAAYIISYLLRAGFKAGQFLTGEPVNLGESLARILSRKPKIVGFTVYHSNYCLCRLMAEGLKRIDPRIIIIFGGPTAAVQSGVILKNTPCVDLCVRNEGEETCLELLSLLDDVDFDLEKALPAFETVRGITYRIGDTVAENPGRERCLNLDKYPSPYLGGVAGSSRMGIVTARGCTQHCTFCNCAVLSKHTIATHSVDRVIEELDYISGKESNHRPLDILDDTFTLLPERVLEICDKIIENHIKIPLICMTRCDRINEALLDKMKEAGFKGVGFSLESAVPRILRIIGKVRPPHTRSDCHFEKEKEFIESFKKYTLYAKKIGFETVYTSIMIGLPGETPEEGRQTLDLVRSLSSKGILDFYAHNMFRVYPGTPVFSDYQRYGITLEAFDNQIHYKTIHAYDTGRVKLAPKSHVEEESRRQDNANIKCLALSLSSGGRSRPSDYFHRVILCAGRISEELVLWLQKYLALNGQFIQVYSSVKQAKQYCRDNEHGLIEYLSPTNDYHSYYRRNTGNGVIRLIPFNAYLSGKFRGKTINLVNTRQGLSPSRNKLNPFQSLGIDREREDVLELHRCLRELSFENFFDAPVYPYMSSLCRWEKRQPNCRRLETVMVDSAGNVKTCWNGEPVGKVGMSLSEIAGNLENVRRISESRRGCRNCRKSTVCSRCIFPAPLPEEEYCALKRDFSTEGPAEYLRIPHYIGDL